MPEPNDDNNIHLNKNGEIITRTFHLKAVGEEWE
jgi:hypothetical protein